MPHPDTSFVFDLKNDNVSKIEHFVDFICDQLLINDTYNGNILISLSEFFNLAKAISLKGKVNILYTTDYQHVNIFLKPVDNQVITFLQGKIEVKDTDTSPIHQSLFLLKTLVDKIDVIDSNTINLSFDISAVHSKVYFHRQNTLNSYFEQTSVKLQKSNDSI